MPRWRAPLIAVALLAVFGDPAVAQLGYFGQNKVHYRDFDWQVLRGPHIDLYFYPAERDIAQVALTYGEESFAVLEEKFGHTPTRRIPLIVYASHTDFEQTNILEFVPPEGILGVTEFLKRRVTLPFDGNYASFRHTLRHELVHAFQLSVRGESRVRHPGRRRAALPLWWVEGLAEFWSGGEDAIDEMVLRDIVISGRMPTLRQLTFLSSGLVYPIGGAIHRWLAHRYGEWRVQVLYSDLWKYATFEQALEAVYGVPLEELESDLRYHFRRTYYPEVEERQTLDVAAVRLADVGVKPVAYRLPGDTITRYLFMSPHTGFMTIYSGAWDRPRRERSVVEGERTEQFESLHGFNSRIDVRDGVVVFSTRYLDRDALAFWDLRKHELVGRYQFPELVSIVSPAWMPDGESVVLSGLTAAGISDLYRVTLPDGTLEQLTNDRYQDLDPSPRPDGMAIVFASDRTPLGMDGALNLEVFDVASGAVQPLTRGPWRDETPRWVGDGRIYFSSDRDGVFDVYSIDEQGAGRRETTTLTGAMDPQWVPEEGGLLFGGFHELAFGVFRAAPLTGDTVTTPPVEPEGDGVNWHWPELEESPYARATPERYEPGFSLDFAAGDAFIAPGIGSAQGVQVRFSDLLGDHLLYVGATSFQGREIGGVLENINATVYYLNQTSRLNWGAGAFRLRGVFFEGDFDTVYDETSVGGFAVARWPFSRFRRLEGQVMFEHSDRFDIVGSFEGDPHRVGWLASNFVSYVQDNSLWLASGPIDGGRMNITTGISNDLTNARFDSWQVSLDYRRYLRATLQSALAIRAFGYYAGGSRPRRIGIGGPWGLRGYPRIGGVAGTRAFMLNQEFRFPVTNFLALGFPFGALQFPGVQGALFVDVGGAWTDQSTHRSVLGSAGLGLRLPVVFPLVLRLDLGYRFAFGATQGYGLGANADGRFADFFFGFNY